MLFTLDQSESLLTSYLESSNAIFVKAPPEICDTMNGLAGIVLSMPKVDIIQEKSKNINISNQITANNENNKHKEANENIEIERRHHDHNLMQHNSNVFLLMEQLEELKRENNTTISLGFELQKRCSELIQKETDLRSHSAIKKIATANVEENIDESAIEDIIRLYNQMVQNIKEKKVKLGYQQQDFDQLALDLQTRLDDKDAKLKEVTDAYSKLKR